MNAKRLMAWVKVLEEAKKRYQAHQDNQFLCWTCESVLAELDYNCDYDCNIVERQNWITDHLNGSQSAEAWLVLCHNLDLDADEMHQWRVQWIDVLIQELKA